MAQGSLNTLSNGLRISCRPKMHEEESGSLGQHVAMQGCHLNALLFEGRDYWVDFFGLEHKITGRRNLARSGFLEVNGFGHALRRREGHATFSYVFGARDTKGENAAVELPLST